MLTPLELDIMKAIWRDPPITVKDVRSAIRPRRVLAYTTVMTIMHRLYQKGFVSRELKARTHYYEPAVPYVEVRAAEVDRLIENFFSGSKAHLREFLSGIPESVNFPQAVIHPNRELDETLL